MLFYMRIVNIYIIIKLTLKGGEHRPKLQK